MNILLKPDTILTDKDTGEILLIISMSPLSGEDVCIIMLEVGAENHLMFAFVHSKTMHTRYEYIGDL